MADPTFRMAFVGLDDSTTNSSEIPTGPVQPDWKCPVFQNLRLRPNKCIQRRGQAPVSRTAYSDPQLLYWTKLTGRSEYRIVVANGDVYDDITGLVLPGGQNRFTPGTECNAAWINGQIIIGNGIDPNIRYDGVSVTRLTVQPCDASLMALTSGAAGNPNGTYQYLVVFLNADGIEGDFTGTVSATTPPLSNYPTITVSSQKINLTNIPLCPDGQDCSGRRIYRTKDGGSKFFLVGTIADNVTPVYTDNLADNQLGLEFENYPDATLFRSQKSPMPPCRYFETHMGRLFGGYCLTTDSNARTVHYSDDLDPTTARTVTYPEQDFMGGRVELADRAAGEITGISDSFGSELIIFTGGEMYHFNGTGNSNFQLYPFAMHGCVSHRTIGHYQNLLLWAAPDGLYAYTGSQAAAFQGSSFRRISEDVRNTYEAISAADLSQASAVVQDGRYYFFTPGLSLVCDLLYGSAWYADEPNRFSQATVSLYTRDTRQRIYAFGTDRRVWQLEVGSLDNGAAIPCRVRSSDFALSGPQTNSRVIRFGGLFRRCADAVSGTIIRGTAQPVHTAVIDLTMGSPGFGGRSFIPFDTSVYPVNTVRMREKTPSGVPNAEALSTEFALAFACDSRSGQFEILEGTLEPEPAGGFSG